MSRCCFSPSAESLREWLIFRSHRRVSARSDVTPPTLASNKSNTRSDHRAASILWRMMAPSKESFPPFSENAKLKKMNVTLYSNSIISWNHFVQMRRLSECKTQFLTIDASHIHQTKRNVPQPSNAFSSVASRSGHGGNFCSARPLGWIYVSYSTLKSEEAKSRLPK